MYQSQVRPNRGGRELVAQQQPKQHSSSPRNDRGATQTSHFVLQSSWFKSQTLRHSALALSAGVIITGLSACGGVTYRDLGTLKGPAGSNATTPALSQISCGTKSLTGAQSKACSVYLDQAATSSTVVTMSSSNTALQVPKAVTIAAGTKSAGFDAVSSSVSTAVSVAIAGSSGGVTKTDVITLYPSATSGSSLSKISCGTQTLTGPTTKACSVYLTSAATSPVQVSLSSNSGALQVPASVIVPSGATTGGFAVAASAVTTTQSVTLTASANGVSQTDVLQLEGTALQPTSQHQVELNWSPPSSTPVAVAGYRVYRATPGSGYQLLNSTVDAGTTYTDTSVQSGQTYGYVVKSVDSTGVESSPSNETTVTIP